MIENYAVRLGIHRKWTEAADDAAAQMAFHKYRAKLIHGMVDALDIEVRDWERLDDTRHHEFVEILVVIGPPLITAAVAIWKHWIDSGKVQSIEVVKADGTKVNIKGATSDQVVAAIKASSAV
jgi:hypothetical protein